MYGGGVALHAAGADLAGSPAALAEQQARWEKERVENAAMAYRSQLAHMALSLMTSVNGHAWKPADALKAAHELLNGAKGYSP